MQENPLRSLVCEKRDGGGAGMLQLPMLAELYVDVHNFEAELLLAQTLLKHVVARVANVNGMAR